MMYILSFKSDRKLYVYSVADYTAYRTPVLITAQYFPPYHRLIKLETSTIKCQFPKSVRREFQVVDY